MRTCKVRASDERTPKAKAKANLKVKAKAKANANANAKAKAKARDSPERKLHARERDALCIYTHPPMQL